MRRAFPFAFAAAAAVLGLLLGSYWTFVFSLAVIYSLAALSLVVLTGWSGQLNLHVAALGLGWGSYAAFALTRAGIPPLLAIMLAGVACIPFAVLVAIPAVKFRGLELAVGTLAMGLIFERLIFRNLGKALVTNRGETPFQSSFVAFPRPHGLHGDTTFYLFALAIAAVIFVIAGAVDRGKAGRTMRALAEREVRAETLGVPVARWRVAAFAGSIAIAGTAGGLLAALKLGIAPDSFNLDLSFQLLAAAVIGGIRSPRGAVIGGSLAAILPQIVHVGPLQVFAGERLFILFGVGLVLVLWRRPGGLASFRGGRRAVVQETETIDVSIRATAAARREQRSRFAGRALLQVDGLSVRFGGVQALDGASLFVARGEICALIGPNGAGKSTLFNVVSGLVSHQDGRVFFDGLDVTELPSHRRAALGLGRTFQQIEVLRDITVLDNLIVAGYMLRERHAQTRAQDVLVLLGLQTFDTTLAGDLPLGLLRILEVGMALVPAPRLLLLDEPGSGLDGVETAALGDLIMRIRDGESLGIVLVEHDMALVSRVADHVYAMDSGRVIAQGTTEDVRNNPVVIERYLGAPREVAHASH